jgi:hypothetical protein
MTALATGDGILVEFGGAVECTCCHRPAANDGLLVLDPVRAGHQSQGCKSFEPTISRALPARADEVIE